MSAGKIVYVTHITKALADLLGAARSLAVSPSTSERCILRSMLALDLIVHPLARPAKRLLRFIPSEILRWAIGRGRGAVGGNGGA